MSVDRVERMLTLAQEVTAEMVASGVRGPQREAARRMGVDEALLGKWLKRDRRNVRSDTFEKVEKSLKIRPAYFTDEWAEERSYKSYLLTGQPAAPVEAISPQREPELTAGDIARLLDEVNASDEERARTWAWVQGHALKGGVTRSVLLARIHAVRELHEGDEGHGAARAAHERLADKQSDLERRGIKVQRPAGRKGRR